MGVCLNETKQESKGKTWRENVCLSVCLRVCACHRTRSHPIYFGGIVLETAPFLDAIIIQAGQGLRCEVLPYIKVLLIDTD